jgi:hypothetical protein
MAKGPSFVGIPFCAALRRGAHNATRNMLTDNNICCISSVDE